MPRRRRQCRPALPRAPLALVPGLALALAAAVWLVAPRPAGAGDLGFTVPNCPVQLTAELPAPFLPVREAPVVVERFNANSARRAGFSVAVEAPSLALPDGRAATLLFGTPGAAMAAQGQVSAANFAAIRAGFDADMRQAMNSDAARTLGDALARGIEERDGVDLTLGETVHIDTVLLGERSVAAITYARLELDGRPMEGFGVMRLDHVEGCLILSRWSLPPDLTATAVRKLAAGLAIAAAE